MNADLFDFENEVKTQQQEGIYQGILQGRTRPEPNLDEVLPSEDLAQAETASAEVAREEGPAAIPGTPINESKALNSEPQPIYTYSEAVNATTEYFEGDSLAANVWVSKYALKDSHGNIYEKTPDDMHRRLARELARIERKYPNPMTEDEIFAVLEHFRYIVPQGSPMAGIGNPYQIGSLSNCFVIGSDKGADSYGSIMKTDEEQVQLMKRRGGVGHDLSSLRPTGTPVMNSALTSTGIVPFMERYSNSTREVAQDGRRGALMLSISIKHPDAERFIDAKMEQGKVTGANVSVKITDEFMQAVINDADFTQTFPIDSPNPQITQTIRARELWEKIVHNAWKSAEPGILFWDTIIRESVPDCYAELGFRTVSTNPCGEIPLCPYDSCRLLAINLYSYVEHPFTDEADFDADLFTKHVHIAQRLMDDIVDLEQEKIDKILEKINADPETEEIRQTERKLWEKIRHKTGLGRRTGIGITAEGDMLAALGVRYGTDRAIDFSVEVHKLLATEAYRSSVNLARDRGAFPVFDIDRERNNPFIQRLCEAAPELMDEMAKYGRRNIALLTIAPTGTTSLMTQTTSGIEPVFLINYKRRRKVNPNDKDVKVSFVDEIGDSWEEYNVFHHNFITWLKVKGYDPDQVGRLPEDQLQTIIDKSPFAKATANDVDWVAKVKMQGAVQKWVDHSISVTVNVPAEVEESLISQIYRTAWESGCKGMTVYRDGSRSGVLVKNDQPKEDNDFHETKAPPRPERLEAEVVRFSNEKEKWIAVVGLLKGRPYEIFTGKADGFWIPTQVENGWVIKVKPENADGKSRYDFEFADADGFVNTLRGLSRSFDKEYWNYAKLISAFLRHGMPLPFAVDLIGKLSFANDSINTWKNGVARALKKFIPNGTVVPKELCPECGQEGTLIFSEGCLKCNCGYSKCG